MSFSPSTTANKPLNPSAARRRGEITLNHFSSDFDKPAAAHLIKDTLPSIGLVSISGKEKSGKTFLALSLAFSIASNDPFWMFPSRKIASSSANKVVLYISAEGNAGFRQRKKAHAVAKGWDQNRMDEVNLFDIQSAPNFSSRGDIENIIKIVKERDMRVSCIIVDTVARTLQGKESDDQDVRVYINNCDYLSHQLNCLVIAVCHIGKDVERGMRMHSSWPAAQDAEIRVEKRDDDIRTCSMVIAKDLPEQENFFSFRLKPVTIGLDEDGNEVVSCVVSQCSLPTEKDNTGLPVVGGYKKSKKEGKNELL